MIAFDINALLRWLMADTLPPADGPQTAAIAAALANESAPVLVGNVVMAGLVRVMRSRARPDRTRIADMVGKVQSDPRSVVQRAKAFATAVTSYTQGGPGFVEDLISQIAETEGARTTLTFDRGAGRLPTFTLLAPGV